MFARLGSLFGSRSPSQPLSSPSQTAPSPSQTAPPAPQTASPAPKTGLSKIFSSKPRSSESLTPSKPTPSLPTVKKVAARAKGRNTSLTVSITGQIIKGAAAVTIIAATVNPITLPIVAGTFIIAGLLYKHTIAHSELNEFLNLNMQQFTSFMDFFRMTDLIMKRFKDDEKMRYRHIPQNILNTGRVQRYAEIYRAELLKICPPVVINALQELIETRSNKNLKQAFINAKINHTKKRGLNILGSMKRFARPDYIMANITKHFQNFVVACTDSQFRFSILMTRYSKEFNEVLNEIENAPTDGIEGDKDGELAKANDKAKQIIKMIFNPPPEPIALTPEGDDVVIENEINEALNTSGVEEGLKNAKAESIALQQTLPQTGGRYSNKTRRRRR
jgi:hypothetical protein